MKLVQKIGQTRPSLYVGERGGGGSTTCYYIEGLVFSKGGEPWRHEYHITADENETCGDTLDRQFGHQKSGESSEPIMVLAYMIETPKAGEGDDQCIRVTKAGFTNEPVIATHGAILNGTFTPKPKLELITEAGIPYEVTSDALKEPLTNNPGRKISFELQNGRRADLDDRSRAVVDDVMNSLPGFELRDAQNHSNWTPFDWIAYEPAPGYSSPDCHNLQVTLSAPPPAALSLSNSQGIRVATDALIDEMKVFIHGEPPGEQSVITSSDLLLLAQLNIATTAEHFDRYFFAHPDNPFNNKLVLLSGTAQRLERTTDQASIILSLDENEDPAGPENMTVYLSNEGTKEFAAIEPHSSVVLVCKCEDRTLQSCISIDQYLEHMRPIIETEIGDFLSGKLHLPRMLGVTLIAVYILGTEVPSDSPCATKNENCPTLHPDLSVEANQALIEQTIPIAAQLKYICTKDELNSKLIPCANSVP